MKTVKDIYIDNNNPDFSKAENKAAGIATLGGRREQETQNKIAQEQDQIRPRTDDEWAKALSHRKFFVAPQERVPQRSRSHSHSCSRGRGRGNPNNDNRRQGNYNPNMDNRRQGNYIRPQTIRSRSPCRSPHRSPHRLNQQQKQGRGRDQVRMGSTRPQKPRASNSQRSFAPNPNNNNNEPTPSTSTAPYPARGGQPDIDMSMLNDKERALIHALRQPDSNSK